MTADRPYRRALSPEEAFAELERCAGTQFDAEVVRVFVEEVRQAPSEGRSALAVALDDDVVATWREDSEPVLGLAAASRTDNLTLLPDHRTFHELADAEARQAVVERGSFAVVIAELIELTDLNRVEGWAAGDAALRAVATAVGRAALAAGGTACRDGGNRLGLVLPGADEDRAAEVARSVLQELGGRPAVRVTVAAWRAGESGEDVIARARSGVAVDAAPAAAPPRPRA